MSKNAGAGLAKSKFVIFHGTKDPYAQQVDDIIGCLLDAKVDLTSYLCEGCGHGDLPLCVQSLPEHTCEVRRMAEMISGGR